MTKLGLALGSSALLLSGVFLFSLLMKPMNPPIITSHTLAAHRAVPGDVKTILDRSCGDCHSNKTYWPWYSGLPGINGILRRDVERGRKEMNFSDWDAKLSQGADEEVGTLNGICENMQMGAMSPTTYRRMHPLSHFSPEDTTKVCHWVQTATLVPLK